MKVWLLATDDLNETQTAMDHVIGLFETKRNVVTEIIKQAEYEEYKIEDYESTDTGVYCTFCQNGEVFITIEAELTEIKA